MSASQTSTIEQPGVAAPQGAARPGLPSYFPALDGVRGIAILIVFCVHVEPELLVGGRIGMDLFFALSGFLITWILLKEKHATGKIRLGNFYMRRALRLLPSLYLTLALTILYSRLCESSLMYYYTLRDAFSAFFYYYNWWFTFDLAHADQHQLMFRHLWSLSVEEQFYFVWPPILVLLLALKFRRWTIAGVVIAGIAAVEFDRYLIWAHMPAAMGVAHIFARTDTRADSLLCGILLALVASTGWRPGPRCSAVLLKWGSLAPVAFIAWQTTQPPSYAFMALGQFTLVALATTWIIAALIWEPSVPVGWVLKLPPLRWLGQISYGLYLYHWPILLWVRFHTPWPMWVRSAVGMSLAFAVAVPLHYLVERPFLRMKKRYG